MDIVRAIADWLLIVFTSYLAGKSVNRLLMTSNSSLGDYAMAITWFFCTIPVVLDYIIGAPQYRTVYWYAPFIKPMADNQVSVIYDCLIMSTMIALHFYCKHRAGKAGSEKRTALVTPLGECKPLLYCGMLLPLLYVLLSGLLPYFAIYGDPATRGMPDGASTMVNALLVIGLISSAVWAHRGSMITLSRLVVLILYSSSLAWISGKRFMIALILIVNLYFILSGDIPIKARRKLRGTLPIITLVLLAFSAFYLVGVRPLSDTSFESVYEMLRVDFGRDDVTKYVIYHELFLDDHILQFPGQSFLSTLFVMVPRAIWPGKPFQHYQYLTSSILNLPINLLPAGTTPSWWEMCIANFSYVGLLIAPVLLVALVALADRAKTVSVRGTLLVLLIALLTQSIDAYVSLVLLLIAQLAFSFFISREDIGNGVNRRSAKRRL